MGDESEGVLCQLQENAKLARLDPWNLPSSYFPVPEKSSRRTPSGFWMVKKDEETSIYPDEWSSSTLGRRNTLEFYLHKNGTKTEWLMHEYLFYRGVPSHSLKRGFYRRVFKKDTYQPASWYHADNRYNDQVMDQYDMLVYNAKLAQLDPWHLPPYYITKNDMSRLRTHSGLWKEKKDDFIGIRSEESTSTMTKPHYKGTRRAFEFFDNNGTKTGWVMHEYQHLHYEKGCYPFLQDNAVMRKVFKKDGAHPDSSRYRTTEKYLEALQQTCSDSAGEHADALRTLCGLATESMGDLCLAHKKRQGSQDCESRCVSERQTRTTADPDETVDNVWQHFTKIRTKDPGVVYAVCHRCDKVLNAYPNMDGISQLERHRNSVKCRSSCNNPSTDEDRKMLHRLRLELDLYEQARVEGKHQYQEGNCNLTQLNPWVLGHNLWYVTTSLNRQTNEGCWEEIQDEFTAIRMKPQQMPDFWMELDKEIASAIKNNQLQMQALQYMGLRRILEFHLNQNGNKLKTGWIMLEYQQADNIESPALFLQGDMVIRKVLHYDKDEFTAIFSDFDRWLNDDNNSEGHYNGVNNSTLSSDYMHGGGDRKRKRIAGSDHTSEVWMYFTKIRTADHGVVYAVCHYCDRGYGTGSSKNGTSHLWRHKKSCTSKLPGIGNVNNGANAAWEAEIWPLFLHFKNYGETEHQASGMCSS